MNSKANNYEILGALSGNTTMFAWFNSLQIPFFDCWIYHLKKKKKKNKKNSCSFDEHSLLSFRLCALANKRFLI